jgi:hypothetical protein
MYGIRVNKKIIEGKIARKKLNATADARIGKAPFEIAFQKKTAT